MGDEKGKNPDKGAVLIFHGYPTSSFDWNKVLDDLTAEFSQVIMYDLLGFGFSDKPMGQYAFTISEQTDIGEALLLKLGVTQAHILSHDYGDTVALELLARHNKGDSRIKVLSLCLSNGGIFPETNHPILIQWILKNPLIGPVISKVFFFKFFFKRSLGRLFGTPPSDEDFDDFFSIKLHKDGNMADSRLLNYISERSMYSDRWVGALKTTRVPVHMIYGPADIINPPAFIQFYKENVPNPSITVLKPDIGHYPQFEAPKEYALAYKTFLTTIRRK
ncbi:mesoderm-specific transcript homolog protein-like isoform X2 [Pecten maximus]|uniref:mesoderm-specific transcript homolog protein-like isoform X2 n=1 Tax=Pecten maximus TaxID=6579 RepID=UPI00145817B8|nr:mesoderm-specific transcript homolog protein-like isoform X2 [Pecten maximus]